MKKYYYIPTNHDVLSLTFDDGPSEILTPIILNILKKYNIKATFFVLVDNIKRYPKITQQIIDEGHEIGLHSFNHTSLRKFPKRKIYFKLNTCIEYIKDNFHINIKYFRPPFGTFLFDLQDITKEFNLMPIGWSVFENDWKPTAQFNKTNNFLKKISKGKILVLHDGFRTGYPTVRGSSVIPILDKALPISLSKGYKFLTLNEIIAKYDYSKHTMIGNLPLLHHEIINVATGPVLFFYWDINSITTPKQFEVKLTHNNIDYHYKMTTPSLEAMKEWPYPVTLPLLPDIHKSDIFIRELSDFVKL